MKIEKFIDEYNSLVQKDKAGYIANLQKKAENGDMTALFLTGYLQFPPGIRNSIMPIFVPELSILGFLRQKTGKSISFVIADAK